MKFLYGHTKFLVDVSAIFALSEWVIEIDVLANINLWVELFTKSHLLANELTCWPIPYN